MRQVFTSPRLENVEEVAAMLRAEGIEVRITNDRSYPGQRRSHFSYRVDEEAPAPKPAACSMPTPRCTKDARSS